MAIYFALVAFIYIYGNLYHANRSQHRRKVFCIVVFGLLIIIAGLRAPSIGIDLAGHYAKRYDMIASYSWGKVPEFSAMIGYEIGYCYYTKLLSMVCTDVQFFIFVTSIVIYSSIGYLIYKKSSDVVLASELVLFSCLYYMCMTMLRQGIAVAVILIAYVWLDQSNRTLKDYIKFMIMVLIASTFHSSAILCFSMVVFDKLKFTRKQIVIGLSSLAIAYVFYNKIYSSFLGIFGAGNNYERYLTSATESAGNMNLQTIYNFALTFVCFLLGYYVLVWKRKSVKTFRDTDSNKYSLEKNEGFLLFMVLIATACRLLIFRMNIINRFSYYFIPFVFLLYTHTISAIPNKDSRRITRWFVWGNYALYFVWMTVNKAGEFYGVVPFSFFWQ